MRSLDTIKNALKTASTIRPLHYKQGGSVDPKTQHIDDWKWRPLKQVQGDLDLHEIPSHVEKFGSFMDDTARRAEMHGLTPRDLIKAYTITRSSIQRGAVDSDKVRKAGLILPPSVTGKIRPEGAFGTWLHTKQGQQYLDAAEGGKPNEEAIAHAVQVMAPFGKHEKDIPDALRWAALHLPGREGRVSELVARARKGQSAPEEWRDATKDVRGIGSSKAGFLASMLGRGDQPTLDARQLILHTGQPSKAASPFIARKGGAGGIEATDRLAARQSAMNLKTPDDLKPYYQHLAHHAVWDKAGGDTTTHSDVIDALQHAATGGAIKGKHFTDHPLVHAMHAAGIPGLQRGGSAPDDDKVRATLAEHARVASPFSNDPENVAEAMRLALGMKQNMGAVNKTAGFYNVNQPLAPQDVTTKVGAMKGVVPKDKRQISWEDLNREGKGGSFINLGGDRSNFGRLSHINGKKLAWPVDLHAGPGYMRELNPGAVWANSKGHSTALRNKIQEAAKTHKGPVYGVYAPMGPRAVDSAHNMFDAVMAQVPGSNIDKGDAAEFDRQIKNGLHIQGNDPKSVGKREVTKKLLEKWPGILNAKDASKFARDLPGTHRSAILNHMDKGDWLKKGFPAVGMTRVAISDPEVANAPGNMVGHRVVQLDPDKAVEETAMHHSTYASPTGGKYVGDLPLVQRHFAMPVPTKELLGRPAKGGLVVHPFSLDPLGRATARKMFEEQKQVQPLDDHQLDSVMGGMEQQKKYGFAAGGPVDAPDYSQPDDNGMYSHGAVVASKMPIAKGTPQQIKGYLTKQGVKPDEFKWSGYDEKLGGKPMVTREEVAKHFHENTPAIKEHVLGAKDMVAPGGGSRMSSTATKFSEYTLPGGANYREHLLTLPKAPGTKTYKVLAGGMGNQEWEKEFPDKAAMDAYTNKLHADQIPYRFSQVGHPAFKSSHWDQPNVLGHLRLSERDLPNKQKALHLEELQSDWAQEGRSKGFGAPEIRHNGDRWTAHSPSGNEIARGRLEDFRDDQHILETVSPGVSVPTAPYVDSTAKWVDLGLKRALYEAAKGGHHKLVITPGEEQAKRYDLSKHFDKVHYFPKTKALQAYNPAGEQVYAEAHEPEELPGVVGKDVAERLLNAPKKLTHDSKGVSHLYHEVQGADLKVGGEGMKAFYDKMLPQALQKLAKRHDPAAEVKLHHHMLDTPHNWDHLTDDQRDYYAAQNRNVDPKHHADYPGRQTGMHSLDITPTMRASILKGSPHFESGGAVQAYASGGAVNHAPSEAQKEAGNYKKKHISFQGLNIAIENEKGSIRKGKSASGHPWRCVLPCDYGYIKGTVGADKDHVDCYVGPDENSHIVFVVNQHNPGKGFDEHKCMLGFKTEEDALCCYVAAFSDGSGPKRIGSVATMSLDGFRKWLQRGNTTKSVAPSATIEHAMKIASRHVQSH